MINKQILKKAIEKAVDNGWKPDWIESWKDFDQPETHTRELNTPQALFKYLFSYKE